MDLFTTETLPTNRAMIWGMRGTNSETNGMHFNYSGEDVAMNMTVANQTNYGNQIGIGSDGGGEDWDGRIPEALVYSRNLSISEMERVYSYLALKYGITMRLSTVAGSTASGNYVNSAGKLIWNYAGNSNYHNDVAGIGRDDASALEQKQSNSVNSDNLITIGLGGIAATNAENINSFDADQSFLLWGNDNGATTLATSVSVSLTRMARIWTVQETTPITAPLGVVTVRVPQSTFSLGAGQQAFLLRSDDPIFTNTDEVIFLICDGTNCETTINFADGDYFTLARANVAPEISITPGSNSFGNVGTGESSSVKDVFISNSGNAPLNLTTIRMTNDGSGQFTNSNSCGATLNPGASCVAGVTFTPNASGAQSGVLTIASNDSDEASVAVNLSGTGVAQAPDITVLPTTLSFTNTLVNSAAPAQSVVITNSGTGNLAIQNLSLNGADSDQFVIVGPSSSCIPLTKNLADGESCDVELLFSPTSAGNKSATLIIASNDTDEITSTVTINGAGVICSGLLNAVTLTADALEPIDADNRAAVCVTVVNSAPVISQPTVNPAAISILENTTAITDVNTTDDSGIEGNGTLTYTLSGLDAALFAINANGVLSFTSAPDFETPASAASSNVYSVTVTVADAGGLTDSVAIEVTVTDVTESTAEVCGDGIDNDNDGFTDYQDVDCGCLATGDALCFYGGSAIDSVLATDLTPAGHLVLVGATRSITTTSNYVGYTMELDENLQMVGTASTHATTVNHSNRGVYVLPDGGRMVSSSQTAVNYISRYDNNGLLVWERKYTASVGIWLDRFAMTASGDFIVTGEVNRGGNGDGLIMRIRGTDGVIVWQKYYDSGSTDTNFYVAPADNDNFIVTHRQQTGTGVGWKAMRIDADGNVIWSKHYNTGDGSTGGYIIDISRTSDNKYLMTGFSASYSGNIPNFRLMKIDSNGNFEWYRQFGDSASEFGWSVTETTNGHYVVAGYTNGYGATNEDGVLARFDIAGNLLWAKRYDFGYGNDAFRSVHARSDGGVVVAGVAATECNDTDIVVMSVDSNGNGVANGVSITPTITSLNITPVDYTFPTTGTTIGEASEATVKGTIAFTRTCGAASCNDAPTITQPTTPSTATSIPENTVAITDINTTDDSGIDGSGTLTYTLSGPDAALFTIDTNGVLSFTTAPDFETPGSAASSNVYSVTVTVADAGGLTDSVGIGVTVTDVAESVAPTITNGGSVNIPENTTVVTTVTASGTAPIAYSIVGGADAAFFAIDPNNGALSFIAAPDFETPTDSGGDNVYDLTVRASNSADADDQAVAVTVTDAAEAVAPTISNSGGDVSIPENTMVVTTVTASGTAPITYSIVGGTDAAKFTIDPNTGALSFVSTPDYEAPTDSGGDNVYDVTVRASNSAGTDDQAIAVTVTDMAGDTTMTLPVKLFLQGPYLQATGMMTDTLRSKNLLPTTSPYTATATTTAGVLAVTGNNAIVDWVLVEVRNSVTPATVVALQSALLQRDGDVVAVDGTSTLTFTLAAGNYYVAVKHRNHLGAMTISPVAISAATPLVDFTTSAGYGSNGQATVGGVYALWMGNTSGDNRVIGAGPNNDRNAILGEALAAPGNVNHNANYVVNGYSTADVNLDGRVIAAGPGNDINFILYNIFVHPGNSGAAANYVVQGQAP